MADERERGRFCSVAHLFFIALFFPLFCPYSNSHDPPTPIPPLSKTSLCSRFKSHWPSFTLPTFLSHSQNMNSSHSSLPSDLWSLSYVLVSGFPPHYVAKKHYTRTLLLYLISNPGPSVCCFNSLRSSGKTFLEILESGSSSFSCCCSAALKETAAMKLEAQCCLKHLYVFPHINSVETNTCLDLHLNQSKAKQRKKTSSASCNDLHIGTL